MKKTVCLLLSLLLCLSLILPAAAESAEDEICKTDRSLARWGIALTASLAGSACDQMDDPAQDPLRAYYKSFSETEFLKPYKVIVIDLTPEQSQAAQQALGVQDGVDIAPALCQFLNADYPSFAEAANQIVTDAASTCTEADALVLLPYERHITAVSFRGYSARAAFIISMESSSRALSAEDIAAYAEMVNVTGLAVRVYEEGDMDGLLELSSWQGTYYDDAGALVNALTKTEGRIRRLFPRTLAEGTLSSQFRYYILRSYLQDFMTEDLTGAARLVSDTLLPMLAEADADGAAAFVEANKALIDTARDGRRPPQIAYAEAAMPDADATYVFVIELHHPERGTESFYDPVLEAALPVQNIPDSPENADYIIRCKVTYGDTPDLSNSNSAVYCPTTDITVHDAQTGALICGLGSVTRPRPTGVVMVQRGNTYYYPYLDQIWEKAQVIFSQE